MKEGVPSDDDKDSTRPILESFSQPDGIEGVAPTRKEVIVAMTEVDDFKPEIHQLRVLKEEYKDGRLVTLEAIIIGDSRMAFNSDPDNPKSDKEQFDELLNTALPSEELEKLIKDARSDGRLEFGVGIRRYKYLSAGDHTVRKKGRKISKQVDMGQIIKFERDDDGNITYAETVSVHKDGKFIIPPKTSPKMRRAH